MNSLSPTLSKCLCKHPECNCVVLTDCRAVDVRYCTVQPVRSVFCLTFSGESDKSTSWYTQSHTKKHLLITFNLQWLAPQQTRPHKNASTPPPSPANTEQCLGKVLRGGIYQDCVVLLFNTQAVPGMTESMQTGA